MTIKRIMLTAVATAALVPAGFAAAPATASDLDADASGSQTIPLGTVGGCTRSVTVWWDTTRPPYAGTSGRITC